MRFIRVAIIIKEHFLSQSTIIFKVAGDLQQKVNLVKRLK